MKRLLLVVVALIVYGSFYPWQFHLSNFPGDPLGTLLHSWPDGFHRSEARDAVVNLALYVPFGMLCLLTLRESMGGAFAFAATLVAAVALSTSIELGQLFDTGRVTSLFDVACNLAGAAIGTALAASFPAVISMAVSEVEEAGVFRLSGAIALLYLWVGYQLFPFVPLLSRYTVQSKVVAMADSGNWLGQDLFVSLCGWMAVSALLQALAGRRRSTWLLALAILALPLKLLIANRTVSWPEIVGAGLGIALWTCLPRLRRACLVAGIIALAGLLAAGLVPFQFIAESQPFTWIPFLALLQTPWEAALQILMQKSFLYGSVVWLLHFGGWSWTRSTAIVATSLAIVEGTQIYLPARTAEITDPLLAILLGWSLMLLDRRDSNGADSSRARRKAGTAPR